MDAATIPSKFDNFLAEHRKGVLVTLKRDGRPQTSNVLYHYDAQTREVSVSVTADRAKARNAARDPRVGLHVSSDDFWAYAVAEGNATLGPVAERADDEAADALVELYRRLAGEHDNWEKYREVQVLEHRLVLRIAVERVYGMVRG